MAVAEDELCAETQENQMMRIDIRRMGGHAPVTLTIARDASLQDLKSKAVESVPVGAFGFKFATEEFSILDGSPHVKLSDLGVFDGVVLTMITESARDYSRIVGPEKTLQTGHYPNGIFIDDLGNFYIAHYFGELKVYDRNFDLVKEVKIPQQAPRQVARAPSGEILVAFRDGIQVFDPHTLQKVRHFRGFECTGVAVEGNLVYACCRSSIEVRQLADGELVSTHSPGLSNAQGVAVIDGRLLAVADRGNDRVLLLDIETFEVRSQLPSHGAMEGHSLSMPNDVTVDSAGNLLVHDVGNERIAVFREDGTFVASTMNGFFKNHGNTYPYISYNPATGAIAVSNNDEHCVVIFSPIFESEQQACAD